ncbi:MAG: tRNA pseudouridine(55) synthase TruB [Gemmatimonadales bacterium]
MNGLLLVDKPAGPTSHDVVAQVRRALGTRAVGHAGTLDPFATGLLVVLVGRATRLARYLAVLPKVYRATAVLGARTDTDDATGEVLAGNRGPLPASREVVAAVLESLVGARLQRPPAYSAKKVAGVRSYRLARRGAAIDLAPVEVVVHEADLLEWKPPALTFRVSVGSGTYVRALARDLGETLGCGAHLSALRREAIGAMRVEEAVALDDITAAALGPMTRAVAHLPLVPLDPDAVRAVGHGRAVPSPGSLEGSVALVADGELLAVGRADGDWLRPEVVLGP